MQLMSAIRHVRQRRYMGWTVSLAALGACLMLRIYIHGYGDFLGSGAFMPAVMVAALFGGVAEGITVFAASTFILFFFFVPPYLTFEIDRARDAINLMLFIVAGAVALYLIRTLNKAVDISHQLAEHAMVMQKRTATLFAELQHRVANNLTFLITLLDFQMRQFGSERAAAIALEAIRERLMLMSRAHRRLYDPGKIDEPIEDYLGELCREQIAMSGQPVTHNVSCDDIVLDLDQMFPVALLVSELVTNCLKHAFNGRAHGHIAISFRRSPDRNRYILTVSDDGCGNASRSSSSGLGKRIVGGLAAQLDAQISFESRTGTTVSLVFPMREQAQVAAVA